MTLILASTSAARRAMLTAAGVTHDAVAANVDEVTAKASLSALSTRDLADALAELKALKVARSHSRGLVLGCDQTLELDDGTRLDQPGVAVADHLAQLSGRVHKLYSAVVAVVDGQLVWRHVGVAKMTVRPLSTGFIADYVAREGSEVAGCVGAYRIEGPGAQLFSRIDGDHFTILGLPLLPLLGWLRQRGTMPS